MDKIVANGDAGISNRRKKEYNIVQERDESYQKTIYYDNPVSKESLEYFNAIHNSNSGSRRSGSKPSPNSGEYHKKPLTIQDKIYSVRDCVVGINDSGNGFLIKNHYIICPASLVLKGPGKIKDKNYAAISNVNGLGVSYSYEIEIVGIDGAGNIAICQINMDKDWNKTNPSLENHATLRWGKSRNCSPGDSIFLIGETTTPSENGVVLCNIADNRYVSYDGDVNGELLLLSNVMLTGKQQGLPVIASDCTVVGMYIKCATPNVALSEFFMRRPVRYLTRAHINNQDPYCFVSKIDSVYSYTKACLFLKGRAVIQTDLKETHVNKILVGYLITYVDERSPLIDVIKPGYIVTHINTYALGDRKGQQSPSVIMWRVAANKKIDITYLPAPNYDRILQLNISVPVYSAEDDFPWYNHKQFLM